MGSGSSPQFPSRLLIRAGLGVGLVGAIAWIALDRIVASAVGQLRPQLERQLSKPLGHPVRIGPYRGLGLLGVSIGPTRVQQGPEDRSSASVEALSVGLDPLTSLSRWKPVVVVKLRGARVDLQRNADGAYWVPGPAGAEPPPPLDLNIQLLDPVQVRVSPANLDVRLAGRAAVHLDQSWADARVQMTLPDQGKVALRMKGGWRQSQVDLEAKVEKVQLRSLQGLLPAEQRMGLQGQLAGDVRLGWNAGKGHCQGSVSLVGFALTSPALQSPLRNDQWQLNCKGERLHLPRSPWTYGPYTATLEGDLALNRRFNLALTLQEPGKDRQLQAALQGPWHQPKLKLDGHWQLPGSIPVQGPLHVTLLARADWRDSSAMAASLDQLRLQAPGLKLQAKGEIYPRLGIETNALELAGPAWAQIPLVPDLLGKNTSVRGALRLTGETAKPRLELTLAQRSNPLLQDWSLRADWKASTEALRLTEFVSPDLKAQARLPMRLQGSTLQVGELQSSLELSDFSLARLSPFVGTPLNGQLSASGDITGPLTALSPDLALDLSVPQAGVLRLVEAWAGRFTGKPGGGGELAMSASNSAIGGRLEANLGRNWLPTSVTLTRQGGELRFEGSPAAYRWRAESMPIDGLELALPPKGRFEGLYGRLSGEGMLGLQPLEMKGSVSLERPGLLGLQLRQALLEGTYRDRRFQVSGELLPPKSGQVVLSAEGRADGGLQAELDARGLRARWLTQAALSFTDLNNDPRANEGTSDDLGTLLVNTFGGSLDGQLQALRSVQQELRQRDQQQRQSSPFHPKDLRGQMDARLKLSGPAFNALDLDFQASGHLWVEGDDVDHALQIQPFIATISGPLQAGGDLLFSLRHLPFSLLALIAPVPPALQGAIGLSGRFRQQDGSPEVTSELVLEDARIGQHRLRFDRAQISLKQGVLLLDLALRDPTAADAVMVTGQVPLDGTEALDVRVLSSGDGLRFLTGFTDDRLAWVSGDARLRLILSGTLAAPQANGFLVVKDGAFDLEKQEIRELNTSVVFDFNRLQVESFQGRIGRQGRIEGQGALALLVDSQEPEPLSLSIRKARLNLPIAEVGVTADLTLNGALVRPRIGGNLIIRDGSITPAPALFARNRSEEGDEAVQTSSRPVDANTLLEEKWSFDEPLVLMGAEVEADASRRIKAAMPQLSALGFDNLRVTLGPKLAVTMGPLAAFTAKGRLTFNGALDPSLQLQGVVQMLTGRVFFFTTNFQLDRQAANVAVFTPSMGLIPYVDVALTSRVSDSVSLGTGNNAVSSNIFESNGTGSSFGTGDQLRLIKVMVEATGPADRLADSMTLRSSPPMPRAQILSLIGGNSLAGLSNSGGGTALAAVLGQTLLSPVIGTITDTFSQRLQFALYPTYLTPQIQDDAERVSGRVPPQLALVTELGVDLTDRFNFSVLAAPNRNDLPPQGTLSYQINSKLSLEGSVDNQGTWQSQFQVFFRF